MSRDNHSLGRWRAAFEFSYRQFDDLITDLELHKLAQLAWDWDVYRSQPYLAARRLHEAGLLADAVREHRTRPQREARPGVFRR
jgi:hypothetical protein